MAENTSNELDNNRNQNLMNMNETNAIFMGIITETEKNKKQKKTSPKRSNGVIKVKS